VDNTFVNGRVATPFKVKNEIQGMLKCVICQSLPVKGAPGVNFINVLRTTFTLADHKSVKKIQLSHKYLFMLLGSSSAKAVSKTLMKLSPVFTCQEQHVICSVCIKKAQSDNFTNLFSRQLLY